MQELSKGQELRKIVISLLSRKKLTLVQEAVVSSGTYGDFEPDNLTRAKFDVMKLSKANDVTELIRLLKQLPLLDNGGGYTLFINDSQVNISQYIDLNNIGMRTISNVSDKQYSKVSLHEYSYTIYGSTKFESFSAANSIFGGTIPHSVLNRTKKLIAFCPNAFKLITDVIIEKEFLRNYELNTFDNSDEVLDKSEVLLPYLTSVIKDMELIKLYINKVWCVNKNYKSKDVIAEIKPLPKVKSDEPTEVIISDEEIDALENVMLGSQSIEKINLKTGGLI